MEPPIITVLMMVVAIVFTGAVMDYLKKLEISH